MLTFLLLAWWGLIIILAAAPEIYRDSLKLPPAEAGVAEAAFFAVLSAFLVVLGTGVIRRWRWTFWLILFAFLAGVLRAPAALLQVLGIVSPSGPTWYPLFQGRLQLLQRLLQDRRGVCFRCR